jgi:acyl carrier protein
MLAAGKIHARLPRVLAETLNADEGDVTPGATLQGDLGAESIDFRDIVFRLEQALGTGTLAGSEGIVGGTARR